MYFTNRQQALILALSAMFLTIGSASMTIPDFMPEDFKVPVGIFFWICGILGFALKELGGWKAA